MDTPMFDPNRVYDYTTVQLADFIEAAELTLDELYEAGFPAVRRPDIEGELARRIGRRYQTEDCQMWEWACRQNTVKTYQRYLDRFQNGVRFKVGKLNFIYKSRYISEAKQKIIQLESELDRLREELFDAMKREPWKFTAGTMHELMHGADEEFCYNLRNQVDIFSRFIVTAQTISLEELKDRGIIPTDWSEQTIISPDFGYRRLYLEEYGELPNDKRKEVFFIGTPRTGKSSIFAGLCTTMFNTGRMSYDPIGNEAADKMCTDGLMELIRSTSTHKYPESSGSSCVDPMRLQVGGERFTIFDAGGEAFRDIANGFGYQEGKSHPGIYRCLRSSNRKILLFIIDYSFSLGLIKWHSDLEECLILDNFLSMISHDGTGPDGCKDCTMSRVDTVAVIVNKSDLMGNNKSRDERMAIAQKLISEKYCNFFNNLIMACKKFKVNSSIDYRPYILTFSLGRKYVGNSYEYDPTDSVNLADFIITAAKQDRSSFGNKIKNLFK